MLAPVMFADTGKEWTMNDLERMTRIAVQAKHLFVHACSHSAGKDPVQRMIAIHDMHNAVEWILDGLWQYYLEEEKPYSTMKLFEGISRKQRLILKPQIRMLNDDRNKAQHHAIPPSSEALSQHIGTCESFFRETLQDLSPNLDYDALYLGVLLPAGLDFRVETDCFPEKLLEWLKGRAEDIGRVPESGEPRLRIHLNLREMLIEAEKRTTKLEDSVEDARWDLLRSVMNILASCLLYGQYFAVEGLRHGICGQEEEVTWSADGEFVGLDSRGYALFHYVADREDLTIGFPGALPIGGRMPILRDFWLRDHRARPLRSELDELAHAIESLASEVRGALDALFLGIDPKEMWRFSTMYARANTPSAIPLEHSDLMWCHDFVWQTLAELAPLVQNVPLEDRFVEHNIVVGVQKSKRRSVAESDGLPF